ncbi:hypothetical protein CERSUDRAFT_108633 [Gelatoporia subvermispora B]|uniref:ABC1 atypical kinase-like domain-containing protein n=1 Tax=Ceriporiopsis subvermispora (strain B) TaxID=914234 RepID=M2QL33_CERS8|nr:hypothetical protein CERSUDRAFT_108633 [Gelatoporia subvermispora B]
MPPGPAYNWLCVASSVADIIGHAARIRATQLETVLGRLSRKGKARATPEAQAQAYDFAPLASPPRGQAISQSTSQASSALPTDTAGSLVQHAPPLEARSTELKAALSNIEPVTPSTSGGRDNDPAVSPLQQHPIPQDTVLIDTLPNSQSSHSTPNLAFGETVEPERTTTEAAIPHDIPYSTAVPQVDVKVSSELIDEARSAEAAEYTILPDPLSQPAVIDAPVTRKLQSSKVPSSRIGRLFHYGGLAASLGYGAASELLRRGTASDNDNNSGSLMLTEGNIKRLVSKLTQMRGAALKLGQFMSIQDSHVLPPEIEDIFRRVQDSAHYMPDWQMEEVLRSSLGPSWSDHFESFDRLPFAAASIGQVHSATLAASSSPTGKPERVAVKIQFPNIVNSIESDLGYVKLLLTASKLLPRGLFLDRTIQVMKEELRDECNYEREASFLRKFASPEYMGRDSRFKVPWVWDRSTDRVLVMEFVEGSSVGGSTIDRMDQGERNDIAARVIDLCLRELFAFRVMQTDPNWSNFLWNSRSRQIALVDFGATREYSKEFIDNWLRLLSTAAADDREGCIEWSLKLGYLTGEENDIMLNAHVKSMTLLATPFKSTTPQPFAFGPGSQWADITAEIRAQIPVMLRYRLTPPPRETYSLNRKLSGAFLLASRLNASVDSKALWDNVVKGYRFGSLDS